MQNIIHKTNLTNDFISSIIFLVNLTTLSAARRKPLSWDGSFVI